tara:strand:+ start:284 stop:475 length:192 start_codon:yes stop_codon:yes gene_type:complete
MTYSWKHKCPRCGYKPEDDFEATTADEYNRDLNFTSFMDKVIKRVSDKQKKELDYGVPEKENK